MSRTDVPAIAGRPTSPSQADGAGATASSGWPVVEPGGGSTGPAAVPPAAAGLADGRGSGRLGVGPGDRAGAGVAAGRGVDAAGRGVDAGRDGTTDGSGGRLGRWVGVGSDRGGTLLSGGTGTDGRGSDGIGWLGGAAAAVSGRPARPEPSPTTRAQANATAARARRVGRWRAGALEGVIGSRA